MLLQYDYANNMSVMGTFFSVIKSTNFDRFRVFNSGQNDDKSEVRESISGY